MTAKIYPPAQERLLEIWAYTEKQWGEQQADDYVTQLIAEIELVTQQRHRWPPVMEEALIGVYFFRYRHHYVFFRELSSKSLGVLSILHESMDLPARLKDDTDSVG